MYKNKKEYVTNVYIFSIKMLEMLKFNNVS